MQFRVNDDAKIGVWIQILEWLEQGWGYKRVADHLNGLGIPGPDTGRIRGGAKRGGRVSGEWNHNTVRALAMNPLIIGVKQYGRFSRGAHFRLGRSGPWPVDEHEIVDDVGLVIENDRDVWIRAESGSGEYFGRDRWERLQTKLTERGAAQRGKRRAPDDTMYPLNARVFDLTDQCGSIMQGAVRKDRGSGRRLYRCGIYMKRRGACHHNTVDAEALSAFAVRTITTILKTVGGVAKIEAAVRARMEANALKPPSPEQSIRYELAGKVERLRWQVENAPRRILEEEDEGMRARLREASRGLAAELSHAEEQLAKFDGEHPVAPTADVEEEIRKAMDLLHRIERVCADPVARGELPRLLDDLGMRIGLTFRAGGTQNRPTRVLYGGVMAFGNRPLPCTLRTSGGRPIAGGLPANDEDHGHCHDHEDCQDVGSQHPHSGEAWASAGSKPRNVSMTLRHLRNKFTVAW